MTAPLAHLVERLRRRLLPRHAYLSFAQEGEDMILRSLFMNRRTGFYVDVGAHDPERFSNTAWFYRAGWSGLNVEANPALAARLEAARPRDVTLACGVGSVPGRADLFLFNEPAVSTFDPALAEQRQREVPGWRVVERLPIDVRPLRELLDAHVPAGRPIDFLTVDVEGRELDVLRSNDWERWRPTYVVAECHGTTVATAADDPVAVYLRSQGYTPLAKTFSSVVFKADEAAWEPGLLDGSARSEGPRPGAR